MRASPRRRPAEYLASRLYSARLRSALDQAFFEATISVLGASGLTDPATEAQVYRQLVVTANAESQSYSVLDAAEAGAAVTIALAGWRPPDGLGITLGPVQADLRAGPGAAELAASIEQDARQVLLAARRRQTEAERLLQLRDQLLTSPVLARLWWVGDDPDRLVQLARHGADFERALALLSDEPERGTGLITLTSTEEVA
jgi:hypothetical protein